MKKKEILIVHLLIQLFLLCMANETLAQNASKQINEIKRNETYLFEEATAATVKEAREVAVVKLAKILADYMEEKNPEGAKNLDDFKDLAEGAEEIVMDRGSQKRVFLYFSKQDVDATAEEASQTEASRPKSKQEPEDSIRAAPPVVEEHPSESISNSKVESVVEHQEMTEQIIEQPDLGSYSSKSVSDESLAEWQKRLLTNFLSDGLTLLSAKDLVNTYRIENKIKRHGSKYNPPVQTKQAFYVFADETGRVIAVLGRDKGGKRLNYVSGNYEKLSDYDLYNYIWFTLNN